MLELKNFSVAFEGNFALKGLNLRVFDSERLSVIGGNGSGKTTLALALASVIPDFVEASVSGSLFCESPSLIMQNPSTQFFAMTVREELSMLGKGLAKKFGLSHLLERSVFDLSEGEKQKVNLAANLACDPTALLLDEPLELLDPFEEARFKELLSKANQTIIWLDKLDPKLPKARRFMLGKQAKPALPEKKTHARKRVVLEAGFSLQRNGFSLDADFSLNEGEKIALIGRNGCGKTTVLKAVAGIEKPGGKILAKQRISFAPQNPSHVFFNETAEAELVERHNAARLGIDGILKQNPSLLSKGQQKMLSVASVSSQGIALLDEPTTWLDQENRAAVYSFINESSQPMLIATHDKQLLQYCDRIFLIERGEMRECSSTAANRFFLM